MDSSPTAPRKDNVGLVFMWKIVASPTAPRDDSGFFIVIATLLRDYALGSSLSACARMTIKKASEETDALNLLVSHTATIELSLGLRDSCHFPH